ncbi:MAG: YolD-like family protein [Candidatus Izemoplasmataceae bacterium]
MAEEYYHDRKMMKWMPFNALLEQGDHLRELIEMRNQEDKPILSEDQLAELNYDLERAYMSQELVEITYFKKHRKHLIKGHIHQIDIQNKMIMIDNEGLYAEEVLKITFR